MPIHDELGARMKTYYENVPKTKLMRRTPVAIRIDSQVEALEQEVFNFFMSHDGDKEVTKATILGMIEKMELPWE